MDEYQAFLLKKKVSPTPLGFDIPMSQVHRKLFPFQRAAVKWALKLGRAALFEECGLGKTFQQVEWAKHVAAHTGRKVLICAPLAVAHQTVAEGKKIGVKVSYHRTRESYLAATESVIITNYDMLKNFEGDDFAGVVLDESSILKAFTGATKRMILDKFKNVRYKLACTATPAPNDHLELGNHAEFLGLMRSSEMISRWFINDSMEAGTYRLKGHAANDFWRWVTTWAICISTPGDLGFDDDGFILPELKIIESVVEVNHERAFSTGRLFLDATISATAMWKERAATAEDRCQRAAEIVSTNLGPWIIWCDTNDEADRLSDLMKGESFVEVRGSDSVIRKEEKLDAFTNGFARIIITKPDIAGFGLNWQHCANMVFVGVTYSFEKTYQALRRSWRFGQNRPVNAYMIFAASEGNIVSALNEKRAAHIEMQQAMNKAERKFGTVNADKRREVIEYDPRVTMTIPPFVYSKDK